MNFSDEDIGLTPVQYTPPQQAAPHPPAPAKGGLSDSDIGLSDADIGLNESQGKSGINKDGTYDLSQLGEFPRAISDIPSEIGKQYSNAWQGVKEGLTDQPGETMESAGQKALPTAMNAAYLGSVVGPAVVGTARSLVGHPMAALEHKVGQIIAPDIAAKDDPEEMYQTAAGNVDTALGAMGRVPGAPSPAVLPRSVERIITPNPISPERQGFVDELRAAGVQPTAGMVTGSPLLRRAESTLGSAPFAGRAFPRALERVYGQFTRNVSRQFGEDAERITPEVLQQARTRLGQQFEDAAENTRVIFDRPLGDAITDIRSDLMREGLPEETVNRVQAQIHNVMNGFVTENRANGRWTRSQPITPTGGTDLESALDDAVTRMNTANASNTGPTRGAMDGATYQGLTRSKTPLANAIEDQDPNVSFYAARLRDALDGALERSANAQGTRTGTGRRAAYDQIVEARRQWANMMAAQASVIGAGEGPAQGMVTPQRLRQALTNSADRKTQYALGRSDLARTARAGNAITFGDPNSNTAERAWLTAIPSALMGAAAYGEPMTGIVAGAAAPGLTGRAVMSPWVQRYLMNQRFAGRPEIPPATLAGPQGTSVVPTAGRNIAPWQVPSITPTAAQQIRRRFPWLATGEIPHFGDEQQRAAGGRALKTAYRYR